MSHGSYLFILSLISSTRKINYLPPASAASLYNWTGTNTIFSRGKTVAIFQVRSRTYQATDASTSPWWNESALRSTDADYTRERGCCCLSTEEGDTEANDFQGASQSRQIQQRWWRRRRRKVGKSLRSLRYCTLTILNESHRHVNSSAYKSSTEPNTWNNE